jgi:hypothetical protein
MRACELVIPDVAGIDWDSQFEDVEGIEARILHSQRLHASAIRADWPKTATPERLAWLAIWAKVWNTLETARQLVSARNDLGADILARTAFETSLHVHVILAPASDTSTRSPRRWLHAVDRLRAFAAWARAHDLKFYRDLTRPDYLDAIWSPEPVRSLARDPEALAAHRAMFGEVEIANEHELERDRAQMELRMSELAAMMEAWLSTASLKPWHDRLRQLQKTSDRIPSFFELFTAGESSVFKRLRSMGLGYSYPQYSRSSHVLHGSSLSAFLIPTAKAIVPRFLGCRRRRALLEDTRSSCARVSYGLGLLASYVWAQGDAATP